MNTFLFAWNPKKWAWENLEQDIDLLQQTGRVTEMWSMAGHKKVRPGDRAFLVKLGKKPTGIIGAGFVATEPFLAPHFNKSINKLVPRVYVDFEALLNPEKEPILSIDILKQGNLSKQHWTPEQSGISIRPELTRELEAVWFNFLTTQKIRSNPFLPNDKAEQRAYTEGTPNQVNVTKYERNPHARQECIDHYGLSCVVCDFNFENTFGQVGKGSIHVHHLKQVSKRGGTYEVNPIIDLRPVCPNCHLIIHKRKNPYTIDEAKDFIRKQIK